MKILKNQNVGLSYLLFVMIILGMEYFIDGSIHADTLEMLFGYTICAIIGTFIGELYLRFRGIEESELTLVEYAVLLLGVVIPFVIYRLILGGDLLDEVLMAGGIYLLVMVVFSLKYLHQSSLK